MFRLVKQRHIITGQFLVTDENVINQIGNGGFCRTSQLHRDIRQHIHIIIDDGTAGNAEQLPIGSERNGRLFIPCGDVFVFRSFTNLTQ